VVKKLFIVSYIFASRWLFGKSQRYRFVNNGRLTFDLSVLLS